MTHPIEAAIASLQSEVEDFQQGSGQQPKENSAAWFTLRAKALGLSYLKRVKQLEAHHDPATSDRFYRACSKQFKLTNIPDAVMVERERLPDGTLPTGVVA